MLMYPHTITSSGIHLSPCFHEALNSASRVSSTGFSLPFSRPVKCSTERFFNVSRLNGVPSTCLRRKNGRRVVFSNSEGQNSGIGPERAEFMKKRNVVEHILLLKAKGSISDKEEKDMLDYLYTSQYHMGGIIAISLGRISDWNLEGYSHVVYMRFQRKEDLAKFYENSSYVQVLKEHVIPYCHDLISVDYESEVEDDILPIFRKGEEFNYGVEFVLLISVVESALGGAAEDALASLENLALEFPSLIVQSTQGSNFNISSREYTHGAVVRFQSVEAFQIFMGCSEYKDLWTSKFDPITKRSLAVHFFIEPVGTEIM